MLPAPQRCPSDTHSMASRVVLLAYTHALASGAGKCPWGLSDLWRRMADELPDGWACIVKRGVDGRYLVQYVSQGERGSTCCAP